MKLLITILMNLILILQAINIPKVLGHTYVYVRNVLKTLSIESSKIFIILLINISTLNVTSI